MKLLTRSKSYSFLLDEQSDIPLVNAEAVSETTVVEVEQATSIPGTAVVRFVDYNTNEENSYYLNFDNSSVSDEFNDHK